MFTDEHIAEIIEIPKVIVTHTPSTGYSEVDNHRRHNLELRAEGNASQRFSVFIRQNVTFIENFSIGLRYHSGEPAVGTMTLMRYNGPHGETSRNPDGHFALPHIHRITAAEPASGTFHPQERDRRTTDRYYTLEQALGTFIEDAAIALDEKLLALLQGRLFDGP